MNNTEKEVVYTVRRNYKGTRSFDEILDSIIRAHYMYKEDSESPYTNNKPA